MEADHDWSLDLTDAIFKPQTGDISTRIYYDQSVNEFKFGDSSSISDPNLLIFRVDQLEYLVKNNKVWATSSAPKLKNNPKKIISTYETMLDN